MSPLDFLAVVLPSSGQGHYCVAELTTRTRKHVFKDTLEDLQPTVDSFIERELDTYFALAAFNDPTAGRTADNAAFMRALFVDIDCNHKKDIPDDNGNIKAKAYPSAKAAVAALELFIQSTGLDALGQPWLVSSGGGVHAYWPLDEDVEIDTWKPIAENFKSLCLQHKLGIDHTVTADAARVLRLPGSINTGVKAGKPVRLPTRCKLVSEGDVFNLEQIAALVRKQLVGRTFESKQKVASSLAGKRLTAAKDTPGFKIVNDAQTSFKRIVAKTVAGTGCAQVAYYMENASEDGMEPLWRGMLSLAKCCEEDGLKYAKRLSALHPYDEGRMHAKWQEIKGPYSCVKLDSENPGVCDGCPHFGKITNPLALGRVIPEDTAPKEVVLAPVTPAKPSKLPQSAGLALPQKGEDAPQDDEEDDDDAPRYTLRRPDPPRGYGYTRGGGVHVKKMDSNADGDEVVREVPILNYDLFVVRQLSTQDEQLVQFYYDHVTGGKHILFPQRSSVSKDETLKVMAQQGVVALYGSGNDKNLYEYVRACVGDVANGTKDAVKLPDHYGWQEADGTYVHGGKIYSAHQPPLDLPLRGLENLTHATTPQGTMEGWRRFMDMLIRKELYDILAIFLVSAGAPLMRFTGISGMTFHFTSRNSGTGKSLGLDTAASIWGVPNRYRVSRDTSAVAMQQRLGLLHSEPLITDEITQKNRNADMEWLPSFLFDMSEGKGKERMEASSNKERRNTTYWCTVAMLSSNNPAVDYLTGTRAHSSEGEMRRLLELVMEKQLDLDQEDIALIKALPYNCGHLGPKMIQYWLDNLETVREVANTTSQELYKHLNASSDERFWMAGISSAMTAGVLLSKEHSGLMPLPLKRILAVFRRMLDAMREHTRQGQRSAVDILNMFVRENYGNFVSITYIDRKPTVDGHTKDITDDSKSLARNRIMGRVERGLTKGMVDLFIEERVMRAFCATKSFGYTDFKRQIERQYATRYLKKNLTAKTQGPEMRVSAICITQPDTDFQDEEAQAGPSPLD